MPIFDTSRWFVNLFPTSPPPLHNILYWATTIRAILLNPTVHDEASVTSCNHTRKQNTLNDLFIFTTKLLTKHCTHFSSKKHACCIPAYLILLGLTALIRRGGEYKFCMTLLIMQSSLVSNFFPLGCNHSSQRILFKQIHCNNPGHATTQNMVQNYNFLFFNPFIKLCIKQMD